MTASSSTTTTTGPSATPLSGTPLLANQLGGYYVHQSYEATSDAERERWRLVAFDVSREAEAVDPYDEAAVPGRPAAGLSREGVVGATSASRSHDQTPECGHA